MEPTQEKMFNNKTSNPPCLGHEKPQYISPTVAVKAVAVEDGYAVSVRNFFNETMHTTVWE